QLSHPGVQVILPASLNPPLAPRAGAACPVLTTGWPFPIIQKTLDPGARMLFASLTFLYIFLPVTLVVYFLVPNLVWKNGVLIFASLLFYAWGEPIWTFLLILSAGVDYIHARVIEANRGKPIARLMVASSLLINLGVLVAFKYSGFIGEAIGLVT